MGAGFIFGSFFFVRNALRRFRGRLQWFGREENPPSGFEQMGEGRDQFRHTSGHHRVALTWMPGVSPCVLHKFATAQISVDQ